MKNYSIVIFVGLLLLASCQNRNEEDQPIVEVIDSTTQQIELERVDGMPVNMVVIRDEITVYDNCEEDKKRIATYYRGDSLIFVNELTKGKYHYEQNGISYQEPWIKVILENNTMGWIHGSGVSFESTANATLTDRVLSARAAHLLGESLAQKITIYAKEVNHLQTLSGFRVLVTRAAEISDSVAAKLNTWLKIHPDKSNYDFYWLNELTPGLLLHYIENNQSYALYRDFEQWQKWSQQTAAIADDDFIQVFLTAYQTDSIEYTFYDWEMPIDKGVSCSLLGSDIHSEVLEQMSTMRDTNGYFKIEVEELKQDLINDISLSNRYWLTLESVLEELDSILARNYIILNDNDRVELVNRRQILSNYQQNDIEMGLFESYEQKNEL